MSETTSRPVGGPPRRPAKTTAPASSLLKRNRPQPAFPSAGESDEPNPATEDTSVDKANTPEAAAIEVTISSPIVDEPIAPTAFPDRPDVRETNTAATEPVVSPVAEPRTEAGPAAPVVPEQVDPLVNATFRVRKSSKKAFDAAFLAAKLHEGWPSAETFFQDLLERETRRIEQEYNNGQPFPVREKALPRGRPITS